MKRKINFKLIIPLIILLTTTIAVITIIFHKKASTLELTPELSRTQAYDDVIDGDETVYDDTDKPITAIQFDAFFLKDKDGDGVADSIRGTCNEIGTEANLYMELKVIEEGELKDATITINSNNFYFNTAIVKDSVVAENYISSNTKTINFNSMNNGSQALLMGSVRSGDYASNSTKTAAIGNDTSKYSMENSVTFSGTYVDTEGNETTFSKTVPFMVDWYGAVNVGVYQKAQTQQIHDWESLLTEDGIQVNFNITTTETLNQLIMSGSYLSGTIPELNGYKPTQVKIAGTNVTYEYNEETGEFTAKREAALNEQKIVTQNA